MKVEQENKLKLILKENEDLQKDIADVSFFNMEKICFEIRDFERLVRMEMFNIYLSLCHPKKNGRTIEILNVFVKIIPAFLIFLLWFNYRLKLWTFALEIMRKLDRI